jgi:alkylation response protein AidB-like acyl-CoA dehydrogenase
MGLRASPVAQVASTTRGSRRPASSVRRASASGSPCPRSTAAGSASPRAQVGLAQAALDYATRYAREREQFGEPIIAFQGVGFMLADMATQVSAARALTLNAARLRDAGRPYSIEAAKAKLFATDTAMRRHHRRGAGARRLRLCDGPPG